MIKTDGHTWGGGRYFHQRYCLTCKIAYWAWSSWKGGKFTLVCPDA